MSPRAAWRLESLGFTAVYDYVDGKADWGAAGAPLEGTASSRPVGGAVEEPPLCALDEDVAAVRARAEAAGWDTAVVVNDERVVLGRLGRRALREASGRVEDAMTSGPSTVRPDLDLPALHERMARQQLAQMLVTTSDGRLVGVVRRA